MDGKEAIIARIIEDAENKAAALRLDAENTVAGRVKDAESWAEQYTAAERAKLELEAENLVSRRATVADLDYRKIVLSAKQDIIGGVFDLALDKLTKLGKKEYLAVIDKLIGENGEKGDEIVIAKGAPVTAADVEKLASAAKLGLKARENGDFKGGIMLIGRVCDKDLSFGTLLNAEKAETEADVAEMLFGE